MNVNQTWYISFTSIINLSTRQYVPAFSLAKFVLFASINLSKRRNQKHKLCLPFCAVDWRVSFSYLLLVAKSWQKQQKQGEELPTNVTSRDGCTAGGHLRMGSLLTNWAFISFSLNLTVLFVSCFIVESVSHLVITVNYAMYCVLYYAPPSRPEGPRRCR